MDNIVDISMSGQEAMAALEAASSLGLVYQLILIDMNIRQPDGFSLSRSIREFYQHRVAPYGKQVVPRIIGVTGHMDEAAVSCAH